MRTAVHLPWLPAVALWVAACAGADGSAIGDADTSGPGEVGSDSGTADPDTATSSETADTASVPVVDCGAIPLAPLEVNQLPLGPTGYHDLAFDALGYVYGSNDSSLIRSTRQGDMSIAFPQLTRIQGMQWLSPSELVVAHDDTRSLIAITADGGAATVATDVGAYGVKRGPDGFLYTSNHEVVHRIDPASGVKQVLVDHPSQPRPLGFSPDWSRLYFGTLENEGRVYEVVLDADLDPMGDPTVLATHVGTSAHDTLGVDACGNLYIAEFYTRTLFRVSPAGDRQVYHAFSEVDYGHGIEWGSGVGGWRQDAIYMPQPYNNHRVIELVVGIPGRDFDGQVIPAP